MGLFDKLGWRKKNNDHQVRNRASAPVSEYGQSHPTGAQNANPVANELSCTSSVPINELLHHLQQPATSWAQETAPLINIKPKSVCAVCCNLNPYQAPPGGDFRGESWAQEEYNVPSETRAGVITVENSAELIAAAQGGCIFCTMIRGSLGAIRPGWETERAFLTIHLADGLPLFVRLQFGSTGRVAVGRAGARAYGVDLPEGQNMEFVVTVSDKSAPPVEIEIYRKLILPPELTICGMSPEDRRFDCLC